MMISIKWAISWDLIISVSLHQRNECLELETATPDESNGSDFSCNEEWIWICWPVFRIRNIYCTYFASRTSCVSHKTRQNFKYRIFMIGMSILSSCPDTEYGCIPACRSLQEGTHWRACWYRIPMKCDVVGFAWELQWIPPVCTFHCWIMPFAWGFPAPHRAIWVRFWKVSSDWSQVLLLAGLPERAYTMFRKRQLDRRAIVRYENRVQNHIVRHILFLPAQTLCILFAKCVASNVFFCRRERWNIFSQ